MQGCIPSRRGEWVESNKATSILTKYVGWLLIRQTKPSQFKKHVAAVLKLHLDEQHFIKPEISKLLYATVRKIGLKHVPNDKEWLSDKELAILDKTIIALPMNRENVATSLVWNLWRNQEYRSASLLSNTRNEKPRFRFELILWYGRDKEQFAKLKLQERCSDNQKWRDMFGAGVECKSLAKGEQTRIGRKGTYQALLDYYKAAPQNSEGPIKRARDTQLLRGWMRGWLARIGEKVLGKRVLPSMIRRSNCLELTKTHSPREIARKFRHVNVQTQRTFYLPPDKTHHSPPLVSSTNKSEDSTGTSPGSRSLDFNSII